MKQVITVLGPLDSSKLGKTLTHEHFSLDFHHFYKAPPKHLNEYFDNKIELKNIGVIRQYPYGLHYNINFQDEDTHKSVLEEILLYKKYGGGSIVENTTHGLNRNLELCYKIAKETNVNIIVGTGHYIADVQQPEELNKSVEELVEMYTKEMTEKCCVPENCDLNIRSGFIGEVGSGWPIHEFEKRSIQATAITQEHLGCGVSFHPGRDEEAPFEIIRLYLEAGGNAEKCVMSHLDRTIFDDGKLLEFSELGTYCQFDLFGTECSYYQLNPTVDMPSDGQRIDRLIKLIKNGKDRILLSHDIHTKHRLINFGGHGFSHIINNILPRFQTKGISTEMVDKISIENPAKWLEFEF